MVLVTKSSITVLADSASSRLQTANIWLCPHMEGEGARKLCGVSFKRTLTHGRGVRHGDHLPPHRYIRNTSTCRTTPTEHLLNAGRRPQTSQKARNYPRTQVGQNKKEKAEIKE